MKFYGRHDDLIGKFVRHFHFGITVFMFSSMTIGNVVLIMVGNMAPAITVKLVLPET